MPLPLTPRGSATEALYHRDGCLEICATGHALANVWSGPPTADAVRVLRDYQRALVGRLGGDGRHVVFSAFHASVGLRVGHAARREASALAAEMAPHTIAIGQVVLGSGFFSSVARSVLSGVQLVTRPPYPMQIFSSLEDSRRFLERVLAAELPTRAGDITATLEGLRSLLPEGA